MAVWCTHAPVTPVFLKTPKSPTTTQTPPKTPNQTKVGTLTYMAPEVLNNPNMDGVYDGKVGAVVWLCVRGVCGLFGGFIGVLKGTLTRRKALSN